MIEISGLKKNYGEFQLDCSLKVEPGMVTGLVGQNGAGKSTTFKALLGLIHMDEGNVTVLGKEIGDLTREDKELLGVVLSDSGFSGYLSIRDIIPVMDHLYHKFDKAYFLEQCRKFELPLNKKIREFSTGMKAKLKVLAALSHDARVLILDEPTAGLDVVARDEIIELLRDFMEKDEKNAILISSHISADLEGLCDELYMIHKGNIVLHEDTDVLLGSYGIIKVDEARFKTMDKRYILKYKKESYGYCCLTAHKRYYMENYPGVIVQNSGIDDMMMLMIRGASAA